jgi:hypothetical protein
MNHAMTLAASWQQQVGDSVAQIVLYAIVAVVTYASTWLANRRSRAGMIKVHRQLHLELRDDVDINVVLGVTRHQLGAIRCFLSRFHNGDDLGARKKTRTHEQTLPHIRHQGEEFRGMPISRVPQEIELVVDDGVGWKVVKELPECRFKELCEEGGSGDGALARVAVKVGKEVVGFVGADFKTTERPKNIHDLERCAVAVSRILARSHKP